MIFIPELITKDIPDVYVRENFKRIAAFFTKQPILKTGLQLKEVEFLTSETNALIPHGLGFVPTDAWFTSTKGPGIATFNYDLFDTVNINVTTTGACVVRFFVGTYKEESDRNAR